MNDAGSPSNALICPKCGHEQEERLDCKKCGVVFSKYYSLYTSGASAGLSGEESPGTPRPGEQDPKTAISDLQMQIRELSARFTDAEFEKAERNQIRADLKNLERQLRESVDKTSTRLEQCEQRIECSSLPNAKLESLIFNFSSIMERLERLEERLQGLESGGTKDDELWEYEDDNSNVLLELHSQLTALGEEVSGIKCQLENVRHVPDAVEPKSALEDDVRAIRGNLDELRQFLGSLNVKQ
jgi:chromosome segregation ATPase